MSLSTLVQVGKDERIEICDFPVCRTTTHPVFMCGVARAAVDGANHTSHKTSTTGGSVPPFGAGLVSNKPLLTFCCSFPFLVFNHGPIIATMVRCTAASKTLCENVWFLLQSLIVSLHGWSRAMLKLPARPHSMSACLMPSICLVSAFLLSFSWTCFWISNHLALYPFPL